MGRLTSNFLPELPHKYPFYLTTVTCFQIFLAQMISYILNSVSYNYNYYQHLVKLLFFIKSASLIFHYSGRMNP